MVRSRTLGGPLVVTSASPHRTAAPLLHGRDKAAARAASHFLTLRLAGSPPSSRFSLSRRARARPAAPHFTPPLGSIQYREGIPLVRERTSVCTFATDSELVCVHGVFNRDRVSTSIEGVVVNPVFASRGRLSRNLARKPHDHTGEMARGDWRGKARFFSSKFGSRDVADDS